MTSKWKKWIKKKVIGIENFPDVMYDYDGNEITDFLPYELKYLEKSK